MKKYIIICFLFFAVKVFSQQTDTQQTTPPPPNNQPQQVQKPPMQQGQNVTPYNDVNMRNAMKVERFRNLKIGGIVLLTAGSVGLIGGITMFSIGVYNQSAANPGVGNELQLMGGVFLGVLGGFAIGGGTAMAIIGSHKEKKYAAASRLTVLVAPTAFRIAYKF